jgi:hypothetical protein
MNKRKFSGEFDYRSAESLFAQLSPAARPRFFEWLLANDFPAFVMKVFETVSPGDVFRPNWHIDAMTFAAELVINGKIKRLITTVPPRHLKSIIFSVALPAFLLGLDPTRRIICVSYSNDLAVKHANDFRAVMNSDWYRRVFPNTKVSREKDTQYETMTTARGYRYATSLNGTLTSSCWTIHKSRTRRYRKRIGTAPDNGLTRPCCRASIQNPRARSQWSCNGCMKTI